MNLSLTMRFDSIDELQHFLTNNRGSATVASTNHDAGAQPTKLEAVPLPAAALAPVADPTSILESVDPVDPVDPVIAAEDTVDLRASLMVRLREMANGMDDPAVLGKFINGFGVTRFSEIADEDLPAFSIALVNEFGAA